MINISFVFLKVPFVCFFPFQSLKAYAGGEGHGKLKGLLPLKNACSHSLFVFCYQTLHQSSETFVLPASQEFREYKADQPHTLFVRTQHPPYFDVGHIWVTHTLKKDAIPKYQIDVSSEKIL